MCPIRMCPIVQRPTMLCPPILSVLTPSTVILGQLNVIEQCINLFKTGVVQRKRVETYQNPDYAMTQPRIHAVVFDPATGKLKPLDVNFNDYIDELHDIYDLYKVDPESKEAAKRNKKEEELKEKAKGMAEDGVRPHAPTKFRGEAENKGWWARLRGK